MISEFRRRLVAQPWAWLIVVALAIALVIFGLDWLDEKNWHTARRETWAQRIVVVGALGLFAVEAARRWKWWLGVVVATGLAAFMVLGLVRVVREIRMEEFSEADRRPTASSAPIDPDVGTSLPATGIKLRDDWVRLELFLEPVLEGLNQPMAVEAIPETDQFIVVQREGEIRLISEGQSGGVTLFDLGGDTSLEGEQGLLDVAIGPVDGRLYVSLTDLDNDNRVISFAIDDAGLSDRRDIIKVTQPFETHNGGSLEFDAQGYLLLGIGDGGRLRDSLRVGQDRSNRLATLLRILPLVDGGYEIPADNPYLETEGVWPEIYAFGLRNPWRISTDPLTGDIWIGDVGQDAFEEVDRIPFGNPGGSNFGWSRTEGAVVHVGKPSDPTGFTEADIPPDNVEPVFFYAHDPDGVEGARNSITGGYIYRGEAIPTLGGTYVYADFSASTIGGVLLDSGIAVDARDFLNDVPAVVALGVDHDGELLVVSLTGEISRITAR
jgi:glucose/arabinose dehydrogenase